MPARPDPKRICGRIGLALFAMLAVWNAGIFTLQWCVGRYAPWLLFSPWILWLLNSVPLYLLGVPVFLLTLHTLPDGPTILRWRLPFGAREYALAMLFCLGASRLINVAGTLVLLLFQGFWGSGEIVISPVQDILFAGGFLPSLVFGVIVPAVGEEYIFRYMIRRKMRGCPDSTYIFFSGLCFALLHGNITQGLFTFVVGAIFAWAYVMTGKFLVPVSMHFLLNFIGIVPAFAVGSHSMIVLLGLFSLGCIAGGVLVFFACRRSFLATLQPPAEAGWPYSANPPRPRPAGNAAYTNWYAAYVRAAGCGPAPPPVYSWPVPQPAAPGTHPFRIAFRSAGMWLFIGASLLLVAANLILTFIY